MITKIEFQVSFSDGTIPSWPRGYHWRMKVAEGHYGDYHGPFPDEDAAKRDAESYFDGMKDEIKWDF